MAKDRTGLQSKISAIFSGVPVPKKAASRSKPKPPETTPESDSDDLPKPAIPEKTDSEPTAIQPTAPELTVVQPTAPEPTVTQPETPEPMAPEPTVTQPTIPEPTAPEPTIAQPTAPEPTAPQPQTIEEPALRQPVKPLQEPSSAKVVEARIPGPKMRQIPTKVSRRRKDKRFLPKTAVKPRRQRASIILLIFLSIVLVFVLVRPFSTFRRNPTTPGTTGQANTKILPKANIKIDWPDISVYPIGLRDPMLLDSQQNVIIEANVLVVKGISYSEDRKYAVIGTETVQEGDVILDATIIKINPNSVEFEKDGERWIQEVQGGEGK